MQDNKKIKSNLYSKIVTLEAPYSFSDFIKVLLLPILAVIVVSSLLIGIFQIYGTLLSIIMYFAILFTLIALLIRNRWSFNSIGIGRKGIFMGMVYGTLYVIIVAIVNYGGSISLIPVAIVFYFIVALTEEIWFRGSIFEVLERYKGENIAILGSAIIFGLFHILKGIPVMIVMTLIGLCFGVIRGKTYNLIGLIFAHWITDLIESPSAIPLFNYILFFVLLLSLTGTIFYVDKMKHP